MKRARAAGTLGLLAFALAGGPFAAADVYGWYLGGNAGQSQAKIDDERIIRNLLSSRLTTTSIVDSDRPMGYKVFGGYQFNRNFALEGGYFNLGQFGFVANTVPLGSFTGTAKVKGLNLDLVGILPISEKFSAFGRVGVNRAETRDTFTGTGRVAVLNPSPSKRDTNYKFGVGLQYAFTNALSMRAEVERYRIDDAVGNVGDIDLVSVGLVYRFGRHSPAHVKIATAPEPVAPAPRAVAPDPVVVAPAPRPAAVIPPPPQPTRVTFSADALFDFDKATLKPAGKQSIDKFAVDLRGTRYDVITVTGHTDRIGSQAYNQALSARRAEAVKSYLVDPAAIPASKISYKGAGESEPVTKSGDCKGSTASKTLINCLQRDRRVEVEVIGTK